MSKRSEYRPMTEIKNIAFREVKIGSRVVKRKKRISRLQPKNDEFEMFTDSQGSLVPSRTSKRDSAYTFEMFTTTVWSVPRRGKWATHRSDYRGNWAPQIVRNLILRYSEEGDTILDQMMGGGTTLIECKLTGRNGIGVDVNRNAVMITKDRLDFGLSHKLNEFNGLEEQCPSNSESSGIPPYRDRMGKERPTPRTVQKTYLGDARNLDKISNESIDLVATHPPYANIIEYGHKRVEGDLSNVRNIREFCAHMHKVAKECYRVLKPGKFCCILIGDTRRHKHFVPITPRVMDEFLKAGFMLKESIIKRQWHCRTTGFWTKKSIESNFLLIMHEHIYVFRKPEKGENITKYRESRF